MTTAEVLSNNSESFNTYLDSCKEKVKNESVEGYYHVDVVAEAYSQGFSDGQQKGKDEFVKSVVSKELEKFIQKANQIYILSKKVIELINKSDYSTSGLFINLNPSRPSVIISIPDENLNNDDFVKLVYSKIFEVKDIYFKLFKETLDLGLISSNGLDIELLSQDGFGYQEKY